jgi:DNA polymerase-3 subunit beta
MLLSIKKGDLHKGLRWVQGIVERKSTSASLMNVLLTTSGKSTLEVAATDLSISLVGRVPATVSKNGGLAVNAKKMFEVVTALPDGEVTVERMENNWALLKGGRMEYKLVGMQSGEFPTISKPTSTKMFKMKKDVLDRVIAKTIYAVSFEEVRRSLSGVLLEPVEDGIRMVATDGHRLALAEAATEGKVRPETAGVIVPRKGLNEFRRALAEVEDVVEMGLLQNQAVLNTGDVTITSKLIEGSFPKYGDVIPKENRKKVVLGRGVLIDAFRAMMIMSAEHSNIVMFKLSKGKAEISGSDPAAGEGRQELELDYSGETISVGINARYVLDALGAMESEAVRLELDDQLSPMLLVPEGGEKYTCVIMPVRL